MENFLETYALLIPKSKWKTWIYIYKIIKENKWVVKINLKKWKSQNHITQKTFHRQVLANIQKQLNPNLCKLC